jgi:LuxR family maltose regulon positive regulatory protein
LDRALQLLNRIQASAAPQDRSGRLIEVHLLTALVFKKQSGNRLTTKAIEQFECALELGEPEGYVLLFLEEGPEVVEFLIAVIGRAVVPARVVKYASRLLKAFGETASHQPAGATVGLVEPLTPREMEVLELLALGDSNQVIAQKLVITVRTVKKHNSNIYGKLNVHNRMQAVAQAREFGLLAMDQWSP